MTDTIDQRSHATIMIVDDYVDGCETLQALLSGEKYSFLVAHSGRQALDLLSCQVPDLILLDVMMPEMDGFEVCRRIRACSTCPEMPIVLITALDDRSSRLKGLEAGADDFITKPFDVHELKLRVRTIVNLSRYRKILDSRDNFQRLVELSPEPIAITDSAGHAHLLNDAAGQLIGLEIDPEEDLNINILERIPEVSLQEVKVFLRTVLERNEKRYLCESAFSGRDGDTIDVEIAAAPITWQGQSCVQLIFRNLTERRLLEDQLREAQKMEPVGHLAAGVAHDFNNVLTIINGYASYVLESLEENDPLYNKLAAISDAGERAAQITGQLLLFSRRGSTRKSPLQLNQIIESMDKMLRRLMGVDTRLELHLEQDLPMIEANRSSLQQIILNLAVNARDAMPEGGIFTISTAAHRDDDTVLLSVSDTGCGMKPETVASVFKPFFTTKGNKGTGLGLSVVQGIVRQHDGRIEVESQLGQGTSFHLHFPCLDSHAALPDLRATEQTPVFPADEAARHRVLVVEDDEDIRSFLEEFLKSRGFQVHTASETAAAVQIASTEKITLLIADIVMPRINGYQLSKILTVLNPDLRTIFLSGYPDDYLTKYQTAPAPDSAPFLRKPFAPDELLRAVKSALTLN